MKNIPLLFLALPALLWLSCVKEDELSERNSRRISFTCEALPSELTRSSFTSSRTAIRSVQLFAYRHDTGAYAGTSYWDKGEGRAAAVFDDVDLNQNYIADKVAYDLFFLANLPRITSGIPTTSSSMENYTYALPSYESFDSYGFPMAASYSSIVLGYEPETWSFRRLVSTWRITCDFSSCSYELNLSLVAKSLRVKNAARTMQPFSIAPSPASVFSSNLGYGDYITDSNLLADIDEDGIMIYVLENCAGSFDSGTISEDSDRTLEACPDSDPTYLEFTMDGMDGSYSYGDRKYRYILGSTALNGTLYDINVYRNKEYYATMHFTGTSLLSDGWYREAGSRRSISFGSPGLRGDDPSSSATGLVINYLGDVRLPLNADASAAIDEGWTFSARWSDASGPVAEVESDEFYLARNASLLGGRPLLDVRVDNAAKELVIEMNSRFQQAMNRYDDDEMEIIGTDLPYIDPTGIPDPGNGNAVRTIHVSPNNSLSILLTADGISSQSWSIPVQLGPSHANIKTCGSWTPGEGQFQGMWLDGALHETHSYPERKYFELRRYNGNSRTQSTLGTALGAAPCVKPSNTSFSVSGSVMGIPMNIVENQGPVISRYSSIPEGFEDEIHPYYNTFSGSCTALNTIAGSEDRATEFSSLLSAIEDNYSTTVHRLTGNCSGELFVLNSYEYTNPDADGNPYVDLVELKEAGLHTIEGIYLNDNGFNGCYGCFLHHIHPVAAKMTLTAECSNVASTGGRILIVSDLVSTASILTHTSPWTISDRGDNSSLKNNGAIGFNTGVLNWRHLQEYSFLNGTGNCSWAHTKDTDKSSFWDGAIVAITPIPPFMVISPWEYNITDYHNPQLYDSVALDITLNLP